jgi:acyl carrier protein
MTGEAALRQRLAELVAVACDSEVGVEEILGADSLVLLGITSLTSLRIIDAVEAEFGVVLDLEQDPTFLDSVGGLARWLLEHGPGPDGSGLDELT